MTVESAAARGMGWNAQLHVVNARREAALTLRLTMMRRSIMICRVVHYTVYSKSTICNLIQDNVYEQRENAIMTT